VYWYKTNTLFGVGWRGPQGQSVTAGTNILYLDQGLFIARRAAPSTNVQVVGAVKYADANTALVGQTIIPIIQSGVIVGQPSVTIASYPYASSFTMANLNLYTGSSSTGVQPGYSAGSADNVEIWNPTSQGFAVYWYKTNTLFGVGWRGPQGQSINAGTNVLSLGSALFVLRRNASPFNWFVPQPF